MPKPGDEQRRSLRAKQARDRRAKRGLKKRGGSGKGQGRKPSPDRPPCPLGNVAGCRLASHGKRGWHCRADRGGCGVTVKPIERKNLMGWQIGYDHNRDRDIGYGVPATCDHPGCNAKIDRGLAHVCGGEHYGGDRGCGLYFCGDHLWANNLCDRCASEDEPFDPKPDTIEWIQWKLTDGSWQAWRDENPEKVAEYRSRIEVEAIA